MQEYLPRRLPGAEVLITVKTYPQPHTAHGETVCTAGILRNGKWVRIHPVPFRSKGYRQFRKYQWLRLDLLKHRTDRRPESYTPTGAHESLQCVETKDAWRERRALILRNFHTSFGRLLDEAHGESGTSLAVVKPAEVLDFCWKPSDPEWPDKWKDRWAQRDFFLELDETKIVRKVPYDFYYSFRTEGDSSPRRLMITDWEIGALYWNCLKRSEGDEDEALKKVRERFFDDLALSRDLHFFVGSHYVHHVRKMPNPFMIVGVFYPPLPSDDQQLSFNFPEE